jgi:hypothetical protein
MGGQRRRFRHRYGLFKNPERMMEEDNALPTIMECSASYYLVEDDGVPVASGESKVLLDREKLTALPASGESIVINYRDIVEISKGDYRIELKLVSKEKLTLSDLGYKYEDFLRNLSNLNNEVMLKDLLMDETLLKSGVEADFSRTENRVEKGKGQCEFRIYETGLVVIGWDGSFARIPYSYVVQVRVEDYRLVVDTEYGESYAFSRMGESLDDCYRMLNNSINELSTRTQLLLKDVFPSRDSSLIRKVARLMKDGRAARRADIEVISLEMWADLENKLELFGIKEEYDHLKSLAQAELMCIGIKNGLMGDLTGQYIYFLAPFFSTDPSHPGNAIAMEATADGDSGRATYFFKMTDQNTYQSLKTLNDLQEAADKAMLTLNRHLINVNFRREPVYLTEAQLNSTAYVGYRRALAMVPSLRELRRLFMGRVMHHSPEQWQGAVRQMLQSSVKGA